MATYRAIAATSQAILGLLAEACPKNEFDAAQFALYQASDFKNPMDEGVSLYLYRVTLDTSIRNVPPRPRPDGRRFRPSLPLDLHYLLTPWARDPVKQQRLLGWCLRALEDAAILPSGLLNHYGPEPSTFADDETVSVLVDPVSLQDMYNIWDPLETPVQLSAAYVARIVAIESPIEVVEAGPVQTRAFSLAVPSA